LLARINSNTGVAAWVKTYGRPGGDETSVTISASCHHIFITGRANNGGLLFPPLAPSIPDFSFIAKLTYQGTGVWLTTLNCYNCLMVADYTGQAYSVSCEAQGRCRFGDGQIVSDPFYDYRNFPVIFQGRDYDSTNCPVGACMCSAFDDKWNILQSLVSPSFYDNLPHNR